MDDGSLTLPECERSLVVFGGVAGIEECVDADESMKISGSKCHQLFDRWVNVCPHQGSRTIRTEEAVLIGLSRLRPLIVQGGKDGKMRRERQRMTAAAAAATTTGEEGKNLPPLPPDAATEDVTFSDGSVSEESSDEEGN